MAVLTMSFEQVTNGVTLAVAAVAGLLRDDDGVAADGRKRRQQGATDPTGMERQGALLVGLGLADNDESDHRSVPRGDGSADGDLFGTDLGTVLQRLHVDAGEGAVLATVEGQSHCPDSEASVGLSAPLSSTRHFHQLFQPLVKLTRVLGLHLSSIEPKSVVRSYLTVLSFFVNKKRGPRHACAIGGRENFHSSWMSVGSYSSPSSVRLMTAARWNSSARRDSLV